ncbi:type VI secretion system baseplate subunit TssG [Paraburkholderia sp. BCC1886]|uniref:type VI secretion system baseplate subunit TssG n=1 Tax=Paraburkholderia sp. BCC1886 TaxID=2562670 RepID=UPI0011845CA9|nr:type VI secretion system baseplate subunit TssG [Paraburkholderia sp. BCC1886]
MKPLFTTRVERNTELSAQTTYEQPVPPEQYGFLSLLRCIDAHSRTAAVGRTSRPRAEAYRLGQHPGLAFAPREIASVDHSASRLKVGLFSLGMLGPNGPLPLHVTEIAREQLEGRRDSTLVDFLDLFHHRYFSLFYRAWSSAQATAGLDRPGEERFTFYVASLLGQGSAGTSRIGLAAHARLSAGAHLVQEARSPVGLQTMLARFFDVPVAIEQHVWNWIAIDPAEHCRLGAPGAESVLSAGALLGELAPDRQHMFRVVIGPLDMAGYLRFTPHGENLAKLIEWMRTFVGYEFAWELELQIVPHGASAAILCGPQRLGWSGWLGHSPNDEAITGMRFEPEHHAWTAPHSSRGVRQ